MSMTSYAHSWHAIPYYWRPLKRLSKTFAYVNCNWIHSKFSTLSKCDETRKNSGKIMVIFTLTMFKFVKLAFKSILIFEKEKEKMKMKISEYWKPAII